MVAETRQLLLDQKGQRLLALSSWPAFSWEACIQYNIQGSSRARKAADQSLCLGTRQSLILGWWGSVSGCPNGDYVCSELAHTRGAIEDSSKVVRVLRSGCRSIRDARGLGRRNTFCLISRSSQGGRG